MTQAALSYAISNLEKELGTRLFHRRGKSVALTECGRVYLDCVRDALRALKRGEEQVHNLTEPDRVPVRIAYLDSVKHLTMNTISTITGGEQNDHYRFELFSSNAAVIEQQLLRREMDLAFSTQPMADGIRCHLLGQQENVIVVSSKHPWAQKNSISLRELDGCRMIAYNRECIIRDFYDSILERANVHPEVFAESKLHSNILDMVSYNMGVALVPNMHRLEEMPDLKVLRVEDGIPPRPIYLLWAADTVLPAKIAEFRDKVAESSSALIQYL